MKSWWTVFAVLGALWAGTASAEQAIRSGDWVLHYMTLNTTELTPDVAKTYGVRRSKRRGLLMLNLQKAQGPVKSYDHSAEGTIRNLVGQTKIEEQRRVETKDAIYTLVTFSYTHLETLRFDYQVQPEQSAEQISLKFHQQMFTPGR
nr:DUF4426 domain-containing protein [Oceanococcus sp. HetDA_MAG_MS8]